MGIYRECQTVIKCDQCLDTLIEALPHWKTIEIAIRDGWLVGTKVYCPKCKTKLSQNFTHSHYWGTSRHDDFTHAHVKGDIPHGHNGAKYGGLWATL